LCDTAPTKPAAGLAQGGAALRLFWTVVETEASRKYTNVIINVILIDKSSALEYTVDGRTWMAWGP
jgi:hypothetical protein